MTLLVCPSQFGHGMDNVEKQYAQDVKSGYHPTGTKANSVIYHEYGHVLANISSKEGLGYAANDTFAGQYPTMSKFANSRISSTIEKTWVKDACKSTGKTPIDLINGISRYAHKGADETFAESFSEVMGSQSPREEAVAVVRASGWYR